MSTPALRAFLCDDHRLCDEAWAAVEAAPPAERAAAFQRFDARLRRHLDAEDQHLFPRFERATGMFGMGPTEVMRQEHKGMRGLLDQMAAALAAGRTDELLDLGDTLLMLIQQHNSKEEQILYPMMEAHLTDEWPSIQAHFATSVD